MSVGNLVYARRTNAELYKMLGTGDTAKLYARPVTLDVDHDIPYTGGNSVDGKTVYIDRQMYRAVTSGKCAVKGLLSRQLLQAWIEHEHTEWAVDAGDNPVQIYPAAHEFATAKEDRLYDQVLGEGSHDRVEATIKPWLEAVAARDPERPPKDLWCGPYLDNPTARDRELLRIMRSKGVEDAGKLSKQSVDYGMGPQKCITCSMFQGNADRRIAACDTVSGPVRAELWCKRWYPRIKSGAGSKTEKGNGNGR